MAQRADTLRTASSIESVAWLVISTASVAFVVLCVALFGGLSWLRANVAQSDEASLVESPNGTVLWAPAESANRFSVLRPGERVGEGSVVRTDQNARATIRIFEGSELVLYPDSEARFLQLKRQFFIVSNRVDVAIVQGRAEIRPAPEQSGEPRFTLRTPFGDAQLTGGRFAVVVRDLSAELKVREGSAYVGAGNAREVAGAGQAVDLNGTSAAPPKPRPATTELVRNGVFRDGLNAWERLEDKFCVESTPAQATANVVQIEQVPALRFFRTGSRSTPCEIKVRQTINREVREFSTLRLSIEAYLENQSVSGGGSAGSEYPLMVRLRYVTDTGATTSLVRGFYYDTSAPARTTDGVPLPRGEWRRYTFDADFMLLDPAPSKIVDIELVASGHDYESFVRVVSLEGG